MHAEPARPASPSGPLPSDSSETRMKHFTAVQDAPDVTPNHAAGDATRDDDHDRAHRDMHDDAHVARTSSDPLALPHPRSSLAPAAPTDVERRLITLIESELRLPAQSVHAGTPIAHLGDSLDWLELLMAVEDTFGVELDPARTKSIGTVADLLRLLPQAGEGLQRDVQASVQQALATMAAPRPV